MAFHHAIVAEMLHIREAKENGIFAKDSKGHLDFTASTEAGADTLSQVPCASQVWHPRQVHCAPEA